MVTMAIIDSLRSQQIKSPVALSEKTPPETVPLSNDEPA
jgi:hypothetical protein